jgi:2-polyprenyl-6-methoxyphenol hydroxylase-like FAD-dependent oxidoreductase
MNVAIVGSGTAGVAAALFLERAGHRITVFERVASPSPVGAGILLQPTGQAVLAELGLLDRIAHAGARVVRLHGVLPSGRTLMRFHYADLGPDFQAFGLHRGALFQVLVEALLNRKIPLHTGVDVRALGEDGSLTDATGKTWGPHDLVIVADGARSQLRASVATPTRDRPYPWGAFWFVGQTWTRPEEDELFQVFADTRGLLGLLPTGRSPTGGQVVSLFWSVRMSDVAAIREGGLERWKTRVRRLTNKADPLLDQIRDIDELLVASYRDVVIPVPYRGRAVLLGDAAHAMSPQLGQGVNLALCDAAGLAQALAESEDPAVALPRYAALRRTHTAFYQIASRWLTPLFQSDLVPLGILRDYAVPVFNAVPWLRRQSVLSMAGLKTGVMSSLPVGSLGGPVAAKIPPLGRSG